MIKVYAKEHVPKNWTKKFEKFGGTCSKIMHTLFTIQTYIFFVKLL